MGMDYCNIYIVLYDKILGMGIIMGELVKWLEGKKMSII